MALGRYANPRLLRMFGVKAEVGGIIIPDAIRFLQIAEASARRDSSVYSSLKIEEPQCEESGIFLSTGTKPEYCVKCARVLCQSRFYTTPCSSIHDNWARQHHSWHVPEVDNAIQHPPKELLNTLRGGRRRQALCPSL